MRRLIFATQKLDPSDPVLAATVPMVRALAARVDELVVLCDYAEPGIADGNIRVHEFGAPTQAQRGTRFLRALVRELRPRPDAFVAHMIPLYVAIAAPLLRPLRIPIVLWYSHPKGHSLVRVAAVAANVVLSVDQTTFPIASPKLRAIGHGIDLTEFSCADTREPHDEVLALVLGRYSPIKGLDRILRAVALAAQRGVHVRIEAHGVAGAEADRAHKLELQRLAHELGGDVPRAAVPELFACSDVLINATAGPSADKVVYEAAASCLAVLASSPAFSDLLPAEMRFERERPETLADCLVALDRRRYPELRERVGAGHSVESWAVAVLDSVGRR